MTIITIKSYTINSNFEMLNGKFKNFLIINYIQQSDYVSSGILYSIKLLLKRDKPREYYCKKILKALGMDAYIQPSYPNNVENIIDELTKF